MLMSNAGLVAERLLRGSRATLDEGEAVTKLRRRRARWEKARVSRVAALCESPARHSRESKSGTNRVRVSGRQEFRNGLDRVRGYSRAL